MLPTCRRALRCRRPSVITMMSTTAHERITHIHHHATQQHQHVVRRLLAASVRHTHDSVSSHTHIAPSADCHLASPSDVTRAAVRICADTPVDVSRLQNLLIDCDKRHHKPEYVFYETVLTSLHRTRDDVSASFALQLYRHMCRHEYGVTEGVCNHLLQLLCKHKTVKPRHVVDILHHILEHDRVQPTDHVIACICRYVCESHGHVTRSIDDSMHALLQLIDQFSYNHRSRHHGVFIDLHTSALNILMQAVCHADSGRTVYILNTLLYNVYDVADYRRVKICNRVQPDRRTFRIVLDCLSLHGQLTDWCSQVDHMDARGLQPTRQMLNSCLKRFASVIDFSQLHIPLHRMQQYNVPADIGTYNILLSVAQQNRDVTLAHNVFHVIHEQPHVHPNVVSYSILIDTLSKSVIDQIRRSPSSQLTSAQLYHQIKRLLDDMLTAYKEMVECGYVCDFVTITSMMQALREVDTLPQFPAHQLSTNVDDAQVLIRQQEQPNQTVDTFYYNTLMRLAANKHDLQQCNTLYAEMIDKRLRPDIHTFSILTRAALHCTSIHNNNAANTCLSRIQHYVQQMHQYHVPVTAVIFGRELRAITSCHLANKDFNAVVDSVVDMNDKVAQRNIVDTEQYYTTVVSVLHQAAKVLQRSGDSTSQRSIQRCIDLVQLVLDKTAPDAGVYNAAISFYVGVNKPKHALATLTHMLNTSMSPTLSTCRDMLGLFISTIRAADRNDAHPAGFDMSLTEASNAILYVVEAMDDIGLQQNTMTMNAMLIAVSRSAATTSAKLWSVCQQTMFEHNILADAGTYDVLLRTFATRRDVEMLKTVWEVAVRDGVQLSERAFSSLLYGFASTGSVDDIIEAIKSMSKHGKQLTVMQVDIIIRHVRKPRLSKLLFDRLHGCDAIYQTVAAYIQNQLLVCESQAERANTTATPAETNPVSSTSANQSHLSQYVLLLTCATQLSDWVLARQIIDRLAAKVQLPLPAQSLQSVDAAIALLHSDDKESCQMLRDFARTKLSHSR